MPNSPSPRNLGGRHLLPVQTFAPLLPFAFDRRLEHAGFVRVERQRSAEPLQIRPQQTPILFAGVVAHEPGEQPARGVVDHRDQIDWFPTPLQPVVRAGVPLHQFPAAAAPRPPLVHFDQPPPPGFP